MTDPFNKMNEQSLLITNFSGRSQVTENSILDLVMEVEPEAILNRVKVYSTVQGSNPAMEIRGRNPETAYAIVDFENETQLRAVRRKLREKWVDDRLMKVRTLKDKDTERHSDRTLVLKDIPAHITADELINKLGQYGAITAIELPCVDSYIQDKLNLIDRSESGKARIA